MNDEATPAIDHITSIVRQHAAGERQLPEGLAERVLRHEDAVQFDDERFEAAGYIRGLVNEALDSESSDNR